MMDETNTSSSIRRKHRDVTFIAKHRLVYIPFSELTQHRLRSPDRHFPRRAGQIAAIDRPLTSIKGGEGGEYSGLAAGRRNC